MMLRTPPARQKRSSQSQSPVMQQVKEVRQSATVVEARSTSSPSKKPRRPPVIDFGVADEPFNLRSLHRGSPWENAQPVFHDDQKLDEFASNPCQVAARDSPDSENESERDLDWDSLRCTYKCRNLVKSGVLTLLDSKEKQVVELKALVDKMRDAHDTSEEERRKLKKRMHALEQCLAAANERENAWQKQRVQLSDKNGEEIRTQMNRCVELEVLLQDAMRKHAEVDKRALALERRAAEAEEAKDKVHQSATRETAKLKQELRRVQEDSVLSIARMKAELEIEKVHEEGAVAEVERLSTQLKEMQVRMVENLAEKLKLEHQLSDFDKHTSSTRTTGASEADLLIKHLKDELSQCEAEVREARKLKLKYVNVELLKERLESEKARADRAEAALSGLADLELKAKQLDTELSAWKDMIGMLSGVETCNDVPLKFAELQRELITVASKIGETNAEIAKLQISLDLAEVAKHQAKTSADAAKAETAEAVSNLKRAERKVSLLAKERDGLKAILASFDQEEAMIVSHQKSVAGISSLSTPEKAKDLRIQQLERALGDAQQQATFLEEELDKSLKAITEQRERGDSLSLMLAEAEEKYKAVDREAGRLRSEVAVLEAKVGRGESNSSKTKVLHMLINPEVEAHGQAEVQALRARLELHERQFDGCREVGAVSEGGNEQEQITVLTHRVTALEKREARYKQVFANKISVFREACGLIFGYKVQMNEEQDSSTGSSITLFTLRSIYSTSEEEQIQFQFKAGNLEMIANEYTASPELQRQVTTFLRNFKSIPAFIANLTMELFNKTTLG